MSNTGGPSVGNYSGEGVESETQLVPQAKYNSPEQQIEELPPFFLGRSIKGAVRELLSAQMKQQTKQLNPVVGTFMLL